MFFDVKINIRELEQRNNIKFKMYLSFFFIKNPFYKD